MPSLRLLPLLLLVVAPVAVARQEEPADPPPVSGLMPIDPEGIDGSLVIVGGGGLPDSIIARFRELAGGEAAKLVVVPTASIYAEGDAADPTEAKERWAGRGFKEVTILHTRDRLVADSPGFVEPLKGATAVWFDGGDQSRLADAYLGTAVEREVYEVLKRGGVVAGSSAGAAIQSRVMISGGSGGVATLGVGFDLIPGAVVDQHFLKRNRKPRLLGVLEHYNGHVGFGIDERTALVVTGRRLEVAGDSTVTVLLAEAGGRPAFEQELKPGDRADLVALRRAARDRLLPAFPPRKMETPAVAGEGSLVIVGGGGMPEGLVGKFVELAGGPEATIVVVPTADEGPIADNDDRVGGVRMFKSAGVKNVHVLRGRTRAEIETPEQIEVLKKAKGVWFGGGRQWRFVDCYEGTPVVGLFRDVLRRGGVIGGSSAGATIQGDYLVRGSPLVNTIMMADGYERGFAFLPGVAIDQHFSQRNRFEDLAGVVDRFPQVLGVGIDESTALVVKGTTAEVVGPGAAFFYHRGEGPDLNREKVPSGGRYDLAGRKPITAETEEKGDAGR
jgi:cyanophycinase